METLLGFFYCSNEGKPDGTFDSYNDGIHVISLVEILLGNYPSNGLGLLDRKELRWLVGVSVGVFVDSQQLLFS